MENISPTLLLLLEVRTALECGASVRTGLHHFLSLKQSSLHELITQWILLVDQNQDTTLFLKDLHPCRRTLLTLLEKGLKGIPILPFLIDLELEVLKSCEEELHEQTLKTPLKLMVPLFFFMFPAYLILLLGPFIETLLTTL